MNMRTSIFADMHMSEKLIFSILMRINGHMHRQEFTCAHIHTKTIFIFPFFVSFSE